MHSGMIALDTVFYRISEAHMHHRSRKTAHVGTDTEVLGMFEYNSYVDI